MDGGLLAGAFASYVGVKPPSALAPAGLVPGAGAPGTVARTDPGASPVAQQVLPGKSRISSDRKA